jgi:preprotein translocase subunit SecG
MESNPEGGANVVTGATDSFYSQNQSSTKEGRLKKVMIIFSIILAISAILFCCTYISLGF